MEPVGGAAAADVTISVDGAPVAARAGQSVAVALAMVGLRTLRHAPRDGAPRGAFCLMGVCQECVCTIDGVWREACRVPVRHGMTVVTGRP